MKYFFFEAQEVINEHESTSHYTPFKNCDINPIYQLIGLKLIVHSIDEYARFECPPNGTNLFLHKVDHIAIGDRSTVEIAAKKNK